MAAKAHTYLQGTRGELHEIVEIYEEGGKGGFTSAPIRLGPLLLLALSAVRTYTFGWAASGARAGEASVRASCELARGDIDEREESASRMRRPAVGIWYWRGLASCSVS